MCRYVTMMPRLRQALVEFENTEDAINCVSSCQVGSNSHSLSLSLPFLFPHALTAVFPIFLLSTSSHSPPSVFTLIEHERIFLS